MTNYEVSYADQPDRVFHVVQFDGDLPVAVGTPDRETTMSEIKQLIEDLKTELNQQHTK